MAEDSYFIRPAEESDLNEITRIEKENFSEPWAADSFRSCLKSETARFFTLTGNEGRIYGYFLIYFSIDEAELMTIAVDKAVRGQGLGHMLIEAMKKEAEALGINSIVLEVRESNESAKALYRSEGFRIVGVRKRFYRFPEENALVERFDVVRNEN